MQPVQWNKKKWVENKNVERHETECIQRDRKEIERKKSGKRFRAQQANVRQNQSQKEKKKLHGTAKWKKIKWAQK